MRVYAVLSGKLPDNLALQELNYPWVLASYATAHEDPRADPRFSLSWRGGIESPIAAREALRAYAVLSNNSLDNDIGLCEIQYPWVLASFKATQDPRKGLNYSPKLLLDSGAFTVWTQGQTVDLDALVAWAKDVVSFYAPTEVRLINLDVIPGAPTGAPPTEAERIRAAEESAFNAGLIRAAGVPVVEVFHRYEPLRFLEAILERRQPGEIIGFGGLAGKADIRGKRPFCNSAWSFIHDWCGGWDGIPGVHGLGISGDAPLAKSYPWFSVDSSTWFTMRNFNLHVQGDGRFKPRDRETSPRTTKDMIKLFSKRRLDLWGRTADQLTRMWDERGVRYLDHPDGVL